MFARTVSMEMARWNCSSAYSGFRLGWERWLEGKREINVVESAPLEDGFKGRIVRSEAGRSR